MGIVAKIGLGAFLFYTAYCGLVFVLQRQMMFPRYMLPKPPVSIPDQPGVEQIWIETSFGRVEARLLWPVAEASLKEPLPAIIFAHGNAELIDYCQEEMQDFTRMGLAVLLVEYPGYGNSRGAPGQKTITETFVAAYDALVKRKEIDSSAIVLFGRSLGGGAVCQLATRRPSAALILQSAFMYTRWFSRRYLTPDFLVRDPFDNLKVVGAYKNPVLIMHGQYDDVIPYTHGQALHKAAANSKLVTYACGHNDFPPNRQVYLEEIKSFLEGVGIAG